MNETTDISGMERPSKRMSNPDGSAGLLRARITGVWRSKRGRTPDVLLRCCGGSLGLCVLFSSDHRITGRFSASLDINLAVAGLAPAASFPAPAKAGKRAEFYTGCEGIFQPIATELNIVSAGGFDRYRRPLECIEMDREECTVGLFPTSVERA
ncbi:MAG: hypothetical protein ACUVSW_14280 [Roseiflexus sp.]